MALAQGKRAQTQNAAEVALAQAAAAAAPAASTPPAKPLSKLQQRALAARKEREEREAQKALQQKRAPANSPGNAMDVDRSDNGSRTDVPVSNQILPSGTSERSLFPSSTNGVPAAGRSTMGEVLKTAAASQRLPELTSWLQPDEEVRNAFLGPSPDDKVLNARKGTNMRA